MNRFVEKACAAVCSAFVLATVVGCQNTSTADSKLEKTAADANTIARQSGGDWEKLKPEQKTFMTNIVHGNESSAKNLLHALSGRNYQGAWGKPGQHATGPSGSDPTMRGAK